MPKDERLLIKQCLNGDEKAQRELFDLYSPIVYGICLRYNKDEEEALDTLQDIFIKIFTKLDSFKFEGSFEGWIKRVATNTAIEQYRKHQKFNQVELKEDSHNISIPTNNALEVEELLKIIQSLPDGYRIIFNMYAIEGYSHKEIAEKLGISEGTSKSQFSRARAAIQKAMKNDDMDTTI